MTHIVNDSPAAENEDLTAIRVHDHLPHSPATVWRALTDSRLIARWLMQNDFRLELGHEFNFHTTPMPAVKFDGVVHCKVLAIEPERLLRYSWRSKNAENALDSIVTWRLVPEGDGTHLYLEHTGFDPDHPLQQIGRKMMGGGWIPIVRKIAAVLDEENSRER